MIAHNLSQVRMLSRDSYEIQSASSVISLATMSAARVQYRPTTRAPKGALLLLGSSIIRYYQQKGQNCPSDSSSWRVGWLPCIMWEPLCNNLHSSSCPRDVQFVDDTGAKKVEIDYTKVADFVTKKASVATNTTHL